MKASPARLPLTAAQLGIWLGQALDPDNTAYWAAEYLELAGALDERALERAVTRAVAETESLRLRFGSDQSGEPGASLGPFQELLAGAPFELRRNDVSGEPDPEAAALATMRQDGTFRADLARGPLVGSTLFRLGPERHFWYLRAHHVALDGFAFSLLERRVAALYDEETGTRPAPALSSVGIAELVAEDQRYRSSPAFVRDREFWVARLRAVPAPRTLLPLQPLARRTLHHRGDSEAALWAKIGEHATALKVDIASWLNAAVIAWLSSEQGASSCTLGVPIAGRLASVAASLPCMAMNILALAVSWTPDTTFAELVRAVVAEQRAARPHQRYRYEDLRQDLGAGGRLFGVVVNWMPFEACEFSGLVTTKHPLSAGPVEDLAVAFTPGGLGLRVDLEANSNAYDGATLERAHTALLDTLELLATRPHVVLRDLPQRDSVQAALASLEAAPLREPARCLLDDIEAHARRQPQALAIEQVGQCSLTYQQLLAEVQALAGHLTALGVRPEDRVAVLLPRSPRAIIAQLAVLYVGAAYVPLDPQGPSERTRSVLEDAAPRLVLSLKEYAERLQALPHLFLDQVEQQLIVDKPQPISADAPAYVIYTSGSTGKPNGVLISRGALDHFVAAARERYEFSAKDRVLQFAPLAFDASVEEVMVTLGSGGTLVLRTEAMLDSAAIFLSSCAEQRISVLDLPTAYFHELARALSDDSTLPDSVRLLIIGGEAALPEPVARFGRYAPAHTVLLNTYGPTETTVVCTTAVLAGPGALPLAPGALPIGQPLPGVAVAVVDSQLEPVLRETEGQLAVLGPTLARGYWGRPDATVRRFVRLPSWRNAPAAYLTGDRVRMTSSGELVYVGRVDEELKISGYRVNPLEVEAALLALERVVEAAVVVCSAGEHQQLAGFIVGESLNADEPALRRRLAQHLAAAAVPAQLRFLERLPRDGNGKIDRSRLRELASTSDVPAVALEASPLELVVARIWREVLGRDVPSRDADFFELGGHSLLALRAAERLGRALQQDVPLSALFRYPRLSALAESLHRASRSECAGQDPLAPLVALQAGPGLPLFCLPPADGLAWCYLGLARDLPEVALLALQAPGLSGPAPSSFDALIDHYLRLILATQPHGPYRLLGWSSGGGVAHELGCRLEQRGEVVSFVAMLDAFPSDIWLGKPEPTERDAWVSMLDEADASALLSAQKLPPANELVALVKRPGSSLAEFDDATLLRMCQVALDSMRSYRTARHGRLNAQVLFFRAASRSPEAPDADTWQPYLAGPFHVIDVDATHLQMCRATSLEAISRILLPRLA